MPKEGISRREYRIRKFGSWERSMQLDTNIVAKHIVVAINEKSGKAGGHDAKAAKGRLARHLVQTCTSSSQVAKSLQSFRDPRFVVTSDLA
jgi:hypothetical protein